MGLLLSTSNAYSQPKPTFQGMISYTYTLEDAKSGKKDSKQLDFIINKEKVVLDSINAGGTLVRFIIDFEMKIVHIVNLDPQKKEAAKFSFDLLKKNITREIKNNIPDSIDKLKNLKNVKIFFKISTTVAHVRNYTCKDLLVWATIPDTGKINKNSDTLKLSITTIPGLHFENFINPILTMLHDMDRLKGFIDLLADIPKELKDGMPCEMHIDKLPNNNSLTISLLKVEKTTKYLSLFDISGYNVTDIGNIPGADGEELH